MTKPKFKTGDLLIHTERMIYIIFLEKHKSDKYNHWTDGLNLETGETEMFRTSWLRKIK